MSVKDEEDFSLEHVIPQFLGGAFSESKFKTRNVCKQCNSRLGVYVDASFEKTWFISAWLQQAAFACHDAESPKPIPLICMGTSTLTPPGMAEHEVCESWLGPMGEQIYWIRPRDENLYWYSGGNPVKTKSVKSRAYFFFSERSAKDLKLVWISFKGAFKKRKSVKKIMCTTVEGANLADIGFSSPDDLDIQRIAFFKSASSVNYGVHHNQISFNLTFDLRFMAKLALGLSYCLFGDSTFNSKYTEELRKALWHQGDFSEPSSCNNFPMLQGSSTFGHNMLGLPEHLLEKYAVTLIFTSTPLGVAFHLSLGHSNSWTILCASSDCLSENDMKQIGDGLVVILYKSLQKGISISLTEYISYKLGHSEHPLLDSINANIDRNQLYWQSLA